MTYQVFTRTWWREAQGNERGRWPNNLVPCPGRKYTIAKRVGREEALQLCERYNSTHNPGRLSRKAEFEEN